MQTYIRFKDFLQEGFKEVKKKFIDSGSDQNEVDDYLNRFRTLSNQNKLKGDEKNIDLWGKKTFNDFKTFVTNKEKEITKTQLVTKKVEGNKVEIARNEKSIAYVPLDKLASCNIGKYTDWCTTKVNRRYFEDYISKGITLVYVVDANDMKPLAALAAHENLKEIELFDPKDEELSNQEFLSITGFNANNLANLSLADSVQQKLQPTRDKYLLPKKYYEEAIAKGTRTTKEKEAIIATDPQYAYFYAVYVIKGRWPEAEPIIAKDAVYSYLYALNLIKGRWSEVEPIIATDPYYAYLYARNVIKGRWSEAEPEIAKDVAAAYYYTLNVINGRFPEAEPIIAKDAEYAFYYARFIIKGRWPEAESEIATDPYFKRQYEKLFKVKLNESRNVYFPKKYSSGLKKSTSEKRKKFWKSLGKYPFSKEKYKLAQTSTPGDNKKSERQSKYTKKFKELYENQQKALKNKSEKSGIPLSVLKKVYNRGMAAWVTGHRPGATQQQWAMARVNSFITKGKTYRTADADLAKGLKENYLEEGFKEVKKKFIDSGSDQTEVDDYLNRFRTLSNQNKLKGDEKNIDLWGKKTFSQFKIFVTNKEKEITKTQIKTKKVEGNKIEIARNNKSIAYVPLDKLASCNIGKYTDWCTTKVNQRYYEQYVGKGIILVYVVDISNMKPLAALAFNPDNTQTMEMFDPEDEKINESEFQQLTQFRPKDLIFKIKTTPGILKKIKDSQQLIIGQEKQKYIQLFNNSIGTFEFGKELNKIINFIKFDLANDINKFPEMKKLLLDNKDKLKPNHLLQLILMNPNWNEMIEALKETKDSRWILKAAINTRDKAWDKETELVIINDLFNIENGIIIKALKDMNNEAIAGKAWDSLSTLYSYINSPIINGFRDSKKEFLEALYSLIRKIKDMNIDTENNLVLEKLYDIVMVIKRYWDIEIPQDIRQITNQFL